jgi:DNA invertase Pin-like site-specific DNA recombinase
LGTIVNFAFKVRENDSRFVLLASSGLVDLVNELEGQKVHFQSITDAADTKTPAGRFFFHVMASLAQIERELILERTRAGLEAAAIKASADSPCGDASPHKTTLPFSS